MLVKDKEYKKYVDVSDKECPKRHCYWPRSDSGIFVQGRGYRSRGGKESKNYICGTRAISGCHEEFWHKD